MLYLEFQPESETSQDQSDDQFEGLRIRAAAVGERISLALANLSLREVLRVQSIRDPLTGLQSPLYGVNPLERELRRAARNQSTCFPCLCRTSITSSDSTIRSGTRREIYSRHDGAKDGDAVKRQHGGGRSSHGRRGYGCDIRDIYRDQSCDRGTDHFDHYRHHPRRDTDCCADGHSMIFDTNELMQR